MAHPEGTVTLIEEFTKSGVPPFVMSVEQGTPYPQSKVMLDIVPPTPANGIQTE